MHLEAVIDRLRQVTNFIPEFEGEDLRTLMREPMERFLTSYPRLRHYTDYLKFLRNTGGAFVDHPRFSLAIYGFGGDVVTSFEERRLFLDRDRYFHFADVVYPEHSDPILVFAFDLQSERDVVHLSANDVWEYEPCCSSFARLLLDFAEGKLPKLHA